MKVMMRNVLVASCSLIAASGAFAAGPYVGGNYSQIQYDNEEIDSDTLKIDAATIRAGFEFTDCLALEARGGMGFDKEKVENVLKNMAQPVTVDAALQILVSQDGQNKEEDGDSVMEGGEANKRRGDQARER